MKRIYLLLLMATVADAQSAWRTRNIIAGGGNSGGKMPYIVNGRVQRFQKALSVPAQFEFAPASGAGMGTACACTIPTGSKGETGTFTRPSAATCNKKGFATTGIANGDIVPCGVNQPRVEPDSNGVLGVLNEEARTNTALRSQEFENAVWQLASVGAAAPTVTVNFATAPDSTLTAERVQFPATTSGQNSLVAQVGGCSITTVAVGLYVKGNGTSGTLTLETEIPIACTLCAYNASTWTWCQTSNTLVGSGSMSFGNISNVCGSVPAAANDVLVWQADCQAGAFLTAPIPTTSAAVARAADTGISFTLGAAVGPTMCISASAQFEASVVGATNVAYLGVVGTSQTGLWRNTDTSAGYDIAGTTTTTAVSSMGTSVHRWGLRNNAGVRTATFDGVGVTAPAASMATAQTQVVVGAYANSTTPTNGIDSRLQVDPLPLVCIP